MNEMHEALHRYLYEQRGLDFSAYAPLLVEKQIQRRLRETGMADIGGYIRVLQQCPEELKRLLDSLLIGYSMFFRDAGVFEAIDDFILPQLLQQKAQESNYEFRAWCIGVATGEEAYSLSILVHEWLEQQPIPWNVQIFATDINEESLKKAREALYSSESIQNVKYRQLRKYFIPEADGFRLKTEIREMVLFSVYDIMHPQTYVPPESIFGNFDLIFCRNVLMYFHKDAQRKIVQKIYRALSRNGSLILGEAELLPSSCREEFARLASYWKIYTKYDTQRSMQ